VIDVEVLARQRVALGAEAPKLRLVKYGPKPKCTCGECLKCRKRAWMRSYRERGARPRLLHVDPHRRCVLCSGPLMNINGTGVCSPCQTIHRRRSVSETLARFEFVLDGGGI
jgi:hypothetical protein